MYGSLLQHPAHEVDFLREAINNLFSGASGAVHEFPPVNVWTNDNGAVLKAELPGVSENELDISVKGDTLTLKGARSADDFGAETHALRRERLHGAFARSLKLPFRIENDAVTAQFERGVLTINLPRAEADKPRKIAVKAA